MSVAPSRQVEIGRLISFQNARDFDRLLPVPEFELNGPADASEMGSADTLCYEASGKFPLYQHDTKLAQSLPYRGMDIIKTSGPLPPFLQHWHVITYTLAVRTLIIVGKYRSVSFRVAKLITLLELSLLPIGTGIAAEVSEAPEEIIVTGRLPGPPLWKVSNGDNVLWIFPYLTWIPKDMIWESERVERVIAEAQEVLSLPETGLKWSPLLLMNPFFIRRSLRNVERVQRNPDGGTLQDNLPPELYARFAALQGRYFPGDPYPRELRPGWVGGWMMDVIRAREGLVPGDDILKAIQRMARRNRGIKRTEISARLEIGEDYIDEYEEGWKAVWESMRGEQEQACFERNVRHMEEDLDELKSRANSWAQGYIDEYGSIDEFHNASLWPFTELHACGEPFMEQEGLAGMITRVNQMWIDAAENALATNASTLAILPINELVAEDGLLSELKAKGYEVTEP